MAKKLLAVLIAVMMVVPMIFIPASADYTYTAAIRYDSDVGHGYSQIPGGSYPSVAYHLMARVVINWGDAGTESSHSSISWVNGSPNSAYGYDFTTGNLFIAMTGWNGQVSDTSNFLAQVPYTIEEGEYYQFDWYVSANEIKGYVNGVEEISYTGSNLWNADGYIISYPNLCSYDILDMTVIAQDGSATFNASVAYWSFSGALWGSADGGYSIVTDVSYTVEQYEIIDWTPYAQAVEAKINAIGTVGYNEWVAYSTDNGMLVDFGEGYGAYDRVEVAPSIANKISIDFQVVTNKDGQSYIGGGYEGAPYMGYDLDSGKFVIGANIGTDPWGPSNGLTVIAQTDATYALDSAKIYNMTLVYGADYVAIEFQGNEVVRAAGYSFNGNKFYFHSPRATFKLAGFEITSFTGDVKLAAQNWGAHATNGGITPGTAVSGSIFVNSGAAIAAARAAYDAANAQTQALVSNYRTLLNAEAEYAAKVAAVAQSEADEVIALIDAIGTVTVDSLPAISAAETAYAGVAPAVQELVTNYDVLVAARAAYDTMVANIANVTAMIDDLGDVYYQTPSNRTEDYDNTGFLGTFTGDNGYSNQIYNGTTELRCDYEMEFDFQIVSYDATQSKAQLAGGAQNFVIGYDFATGSFTVNSGSPWTDLDPDNDIGIGATAMTLIPEAVYHWKMHAAGNRVTLEIDGVKVAEINGGTAENPIRVDGNYFIFYPYYCDVKFANYTFSVNTGAGYTPVEANLNGAALIASSTWGRPGTGYGTEVVALHADAILDSGDALAAARAAYDALTAYEKSQIANYSELTAKEAEYAELANAEPPHVHNYTAVVTPPTCTEAGYTTYTCECGDSYVADEVPATGHNFVDGFCTVCGAEDPNYVPPVVVLLGDVNGDDEVNSKDITLLRRFIANYDDETETSTVEVAAGADFNEDGSVNSKDLIALRKYIANMD